MEKLCGIFRRKKPTTEKKPVPPPPPATEKSIKVPFGKALEPRPLNQNEITTAKYTFLTFFPKFLFEQFRRYANIFFLSIGILQQIPHVSPTGRFVTLVPFTFILMLTALKEIVEDWKRHLADKKINSSNAKIFDCSCKSLKSLAWKDLCLGDIVKVEDGQFFPADLVLLASSEPQGLCYIETANLDGETNLKIRSPSTLTSEINEETLRRGYRGRVECEKPNRNLYEFNGNIALEGGNFSSDQRPSPLTPTNVLLRGSKLMNTPWILGVAIYTGRETKLMMNSTKAPLKQSNIDKITNGQIMMLLLILFLMSGLSAMGFEQTFKRGEKHDYFPFTPQPGPIGFLFNFLTFVILYNNLIPISLLVTLEFVKLVQAFFINWDSKMYCGKSDTYALARTSNLNEELGQIKYVFSDKTGTLTENVMNFQQCSIAGKRFAVDSPNNMTIKHEAEFFFISMAICHTVIPETNGEGQLVYNASSPDEKALVEGAARFGFEFISRDPDTVKVKHVNDGGSIQSYQILDIIEFTSARKRMSCIARFPDGKLYLLIKGADTVIQDRLGLDDSIHSKHLKATNRHLDRFAHEGLRTLCLAYKSIDESTYKAWKNEFIDASNAIDNRDEKIDAVAAKLEKDLILLGATAIEDKLQDGVPQTISNLLQAKIKVWILTGDKQETAINIGMSCQLLKGDHNLIKINAESLAKTKSLLLSESYKFGKEYQTGKVDLIIDGQTLTFALQPSLRRTFVNLCSQCCAVICCRVSPLQKAEVVGAVQEFDEEAITLSIGDGANDVAMIQRAHVGVGISGQEGLQAVNSADFAIAQFRFLQRLLFVHGAWNYTRVANVILYSFYKNICLYIIELWFAMYSYWTGQILFERWTIGLYNLLMTSAPPVAIGLFDQSCKADIRMNNPKLYTTGQKSTQFSVSVFWNWVLTAVFHSAVLFFVPMGIFSSGVIGLNAKSTDYLTLGNTVYSCVIITVCLKALLVSESWSWPILVASLGSIGLWLAFLSAYSFFWSAGFGIAANMAGMIEILSTTPLFWLSIVTIPIFALILDVCQKVITTHMKPTVVDKVKIASVSKPPKIDPARWNKLKKDAKIFSPKQTKNKEKGGTEMKATRSSFAFSQDTNVQQHKLARIMSMKKKMASPLLIL